MHGLNDSSRIPNSDRLRLDQKAKMLSSTMAPRIPSSGMTSAEISRCMIHERKSSRDHPERSSAPPNRGRRLVRSTADFAVRIPDSIKTLRIPKTSVADPVGILRGFSWERIEQTRGEAQDIDLSSREPAILAFNLRADSSDWRILGSRNGGSTFEQFELRLSHPNPAGDQWAPVTGPIPPELEVFQISRHLEGLAVDINEETRQELKALGYLDSGGE